MMHDRYATLPRLGAYVVLPDGSLVGRAILAPPLPAYGANRAARLNVRRAHCSGGDYCPTAGTRNPTCS